MTPLLLLLLLWGKSCILCVRQSNPSNASTAGTGKTVVKHTSTAEM
jgi:hypothetical protein